MAIVWLMGVLATFCITLLMVLRWKPERRKNS